MKLLNKILTIILTLIFISPAYADTTVLKTFSAPTKTVSTTTVGTKTPAAVKPASKVTPASKPIAANTKPVATTVKPTVSSRPATTQAKQNTTSAVNTVKKTDTTKQTNIPVSNITNTACPATDPLVPPMPKYKIPKSAQEIPIEFIYKEAAYGISTIDPTSNVMNRYYPGLRGSNQLIIYTPDFGLRTGTNEFGSEAIVIDNTVVQINGADSIIPMDGFVISGHGAAKKWINENISIGSKIYIDPENKKIKVFYTPDSLIFAAKEKIKEANALMQYYRERDILYDDKKAVVYINRSKELMRKAEKDQDNAQIYINDAMDAANMAIKNAIPYQPKELKGIWVRPTEKTPEEIIKTIDRIQSAGITNIFLETYFHAKTIYPSEVLNSYGITNQREEFTGFDPLRIWVDECKKRNIKINIWFETFYVGNNNPKDNPRHILSVYPDWANTTKAGVNSETPVASLSEHNGYFIDPANPEVQDYLIRVIREIICKYHPDGINLDYIRYPQSVEPKYSNYDMTNWGYTKYARNEFASLYQVDPIDIKYNTPNWYIWAQFRQNKITNFVKTVKEITSAENITLTTVVFPDRQKSLDTKMQDWKTWSLNNYVNGLTPLILTSDKNTAASMMKDIKDNTLPCTKVYPGLFVTFMGGAFDDLLMQIQESRKVGADGVVLFDYAHLDSKYLDTLQARVFNPASEVVQSDSQYKYQPECSTKSIPKKKKKRKSFLYN